MHCRRPDNVIRYRPTLSGTMAVFYNTTVIPHVFCTRWRQFYFLMYTCIYILCWNTLWIRSKLRYLRSWFMTMKHHNNNFIVLIAPRHSGRSEKNLLILQFVFCLFCLWSVFPVEEKLWILFLRPRHLRIEICTKTTRYVKQVIFGICSPKKLYIYI